MKKRKLIIVLLIAALVTIVTIFVTNEITFKSNQTWVEVSNQELPKPVLDNFVQQKKNRQFYLLTLLDSNYAGKIFFNTTNNHFGFFGYDFYTIEYLNKKIIAKIEYLRPPFIVFEDKIYAELYRKFDNYSLTTPLHVFSTSLK